MSEGSAPPSTLPYPPIHKDKKFVVLSDWDGTITTHDSNDYLTDNYGFGKEKRRQLNFDVLEGKSTFRDTFHDDLASVAANGHTFEECKEILRNNIHLDSGFEEFYGWCKARDIPVIIVSSGMEPLIRAVLSKHVGEEAAKEIDIIANDVNILPDGKWEIKFRHPSSGFGHDKSQAILPYRNLPNPPTLFFFGDGVSDISAAKHADLLFVKTKDNGENDLATYCQREGIKHALFNHFSNALPAFESVVDGKKTIDEVVV
ncbi:HAD-like domain-containing protein [Gymnopilus junonius]|uniref:HAD-like domain-containing protein n=1 Tax=Gymnopilus junonius TaxID=109634 RepID=A0A9P5TGJ9_GYMJU|nr:HAD-like domain-containing protein [Gymnopilus junonius]